MLTPLHLAPRAGRVVALLALLGCAGDVVAPRPVEDATGLFWSLTLDHRAITISTVAPHDTIRLVATPRDARGGAIPDAPAATFRSTNVEVLRVDEDGLVQAVRPGQAQIVSSTTIGGLTHSDVATVRITTDPEPPVLTTFSIQPLPPDSAIWEVGFLPKEVAARALDESDVGIFGLPVDYRSSDTTVAKIDEFGYLMGVRPGTTDIVATTTVYGISRSDTVTYAITMPTFKLVVARHASEVGADPNGPARVFLPSEVTIAAGGTVSFINATGRGMDVIFDDPAGVAEDPLFCACGAGDIPVYGDTTATGTANGWDTFRSRKFPVAGSYPYRSTTTGATGRVVVMPPPPR